MTNTSSHKIVANEGAPSPNQGVVYSFHQGKQHAVVDCQDLYVKYRDQSAIDGLTCAFPSASLTAIIGPNGGGKSTLLKAIKGFIRPASGRIKCRNTKQQQIAYLPQHPEIDRSFPISVYDIVAMGACPNVGFFKRFSDDCQKKILQALEEVGLADYRDRPLHTLSGGQFQRMLFARLALQDAKVILLDEPFAAIDASTMEALSQLLCKWQKQGKTIIAVLHDLDIVRDFFPSTLLLARSCVAWGPTKKVLTLENLRRSKATSLKWDAPEHLGR